MMQRLLFLLLVLCFVLIGCRQNSEPSPNANVQIDVRYEPDPPTAGEGTIIVTLRDASGSPIDNATLDLRGDMNHAGMVPVLQQVSESENGEYLVLFDWNMGGDWILTVTATLADGSTAEERFDVNVTQP
jgi:hypothetical protein